MAPLWWMWGFKRYFFKRFVQESDQGDRFIRLVNRGIFRTFLDQILLVFASCRRWFELYIVVLRFVRCYIADIRHWICNVLTGEVANQLTQSFIFSREYHDPNLFANRLLVSPEGWRYEADDHRRDWQSGSANLSGSKGWGCWRVERTPQRFPQRSRADPRNPEEYSMSVTMV